MTMSLDGFIAGPGISKADPMGKNGQRLHDWLFKGKTETDDVMIKDIMNNSGAVITGSTTYTTAIEDAWEGRSPFTVPVFVICHAVPAVKKEGFSYITDGILSALDKAKVAAGEKNVWVMGGANIIQQFLELKLFNEIHIHIAPVLFAEGTRLFDCIGKDRVELNKFKTIDTPAATHIYYEAVK